MDLLSYSREFDCESDLSMFYIERGKSSNNGNGFKECIAVVEYAIRMAIIFPDFIIKALAR